MSECGRPKNPWTIEDEIIMAQIRREIKQRNEREEREAAMAGPSIFAPLFARLKKACAGKSVTIAGQKIDAERAIFELELLIFGYESVTWRDFDEIKKVKTSDLGLVAYALSAVAHKLPHDRHSRALELLTQIETLL